MKSNLFPKTGGGVIVPDKFVSPFQEPISTVTSGDGLYAITHNKVSDTLDDTNFSKTEYRYAGSNPNNYVTFNNEEAGWRIIGLVNVMTTEGNVEQRIKLIRAKSIGEYSWDTSSSTDNQGQGYNNWSDSELMYLLNEGFSTHSNEEVVANNSLYWDGGNGNCYRAKNYETTSCDFTSNGLTDQNSRDMIDKVRWNLGGLDFGLQLDAFPTSLIYNAERGSETNSSFPHFWDGKVGLHYASDYGYASSTCSAGLLERCVSNNWLSSDFVWTMSVNSTSNQSILSYLSGAGWYFTSGDMYGYIYPTLYLKKSVHIVSGDGTENFPYHLAIS